METLAAIVEVVSVVLMIGGSGGAAYYVWKAGRGL